MTIPVNLSKVHFSRDWSLGQRSMARTGVVSASAGADGAKLVGQTSQLFIYGRRALKTLGRGEGIEGEEDKGRKGVQGEVDS